MWRTHSRASRCLERPRQPHPFCRLLLLGVRSQRRHAGIARPLWGGLAGGILTTGDPSSLSVETDEVKALGRLAFQIAEECRSGYSSLVTDTKITIDSWVGNNAGTFTAAWEEFHEGADQVWDALFELAEKLGVTAETLRATDQSYAAGISSLDLP
ncbi:WXG100 family type VII secretion target [Nocardia sp. GCM10030253]|uniref:WXG100 family type VII secretion target n=1 Tax=Nocardia sp. GCM10030253 TaxID=3273404 RepID=UPI003636B085